MTHCDMNQLINTDDGQRKSQKVGAIKLYFIVQGLASDRMELHSVHIHLTLL